MLQFQRHQSTPVLAKGGTYDGWTADALAAPSVCWDGTQFVMTVSFWSIANAKWASGFFTSPDLVTWTYVTGSLRAPQGSDYILGNAGLAWWNGKYWFAYNHYPGGANGVAIQTSTDLINWTTVYDFLPSPAGNEYNADPSLSVNAPSGALELWSLDGSRNTCLTTTSDPTGVTWSSSAVMHTKPAWAPTDYGEPDAFYGADGTRYLTFDFASESGRRGIGQAASAGQDTSWTTYGSVLGMAALNAWEAVNIFDSSNVGVFSLNGRGAVRWMVYAGSDTVAATDNTNSSIGLAWMDIGGATPAPSSNRRRRGLSGLGGLRGIFG
jgi:hypothetical protein